MKKSLMIALSIFIIFSLHGCGDTSEKENEIATKLKEQGYEQECEDKVCRLIKGNYEFVYKERDQYDLTLAFYYIDYNILIQYLPEHDSFTMSEGEYICFYLVGFEADSDCNNEAIKKIEEVKKAYNRELHNIGISEKELHDYMEELYNNSFI